MKKESEYTFTPNSWYKNNREFDVLIGQTLKSIQQKGDACIEMETEEGIKYRLLHHQNCCESVTIENIVGDLNDLVGNPITLAEQVSGETPLDYKFEYEPDSYTWTFYKLATIKGYVDIRWLGQSKGAYSEEVTFERF